MTPTEIIREAMERVGASEAELVACQLWGEALALLAEGRDHLETLKGYGLSHYHMAMDLAARYAKRCAELCGDNS